MSTIATNYRRTLILLWLAAAVLLGLSWWHVVALVNESHDKEIATAEHDLANLTRVRQEHANRTFRGADQVIRFIQSRYLEIGNKLDLAELTRKGVIDAEIFPQVGIIDARGIYVLANLPVTGKLDLSDREHFKVHVAADNGELFVSKPVLGRASGEWSIQLTRRITRDNGDFAGVVVVSIAVDYFNHFYSDLKLGSQGVVALYGLDGIARVRRVGDKEDVGANAAGAPMFTRMAQGQLEGSYSNRSIVDGIDRLYFYRKIPGYQLVVVDGLDTHYLLANHNSAKQALWLQAAMVSLLILALAAALTRYLRQLRREFGIRQRAQQQVEERNEQLNAIFELSPDGFVSFDVHKRVKYVSTAFAQLTGQGEEQLEGLDERDFSAWLAQRCTPNRDFVSVAALRAQVSSGRPDHREVIELNAPHKRVLQMGMRCSGSNQVSQILYLRDVTRETEVDNMKSEFLATAAHELRTPMASILGYSEILLNQAFDSATQHEFLDTIYSQSKLMANILNELLDLARIEARRDKDFRYTQIELHELLTDLGKSYPLPAGRSVPELNLPGQALCLMADVGKLRQALLNVISNAYKYSPNGGSVQIRAWVPDVAGQPPMVCIEITDHGIGLTPEQIKRVCERFYRADTSGKILGTGLGMSIVKEIIELHLGQLSIDSTPGQGTSVWLCLPTHTTPSGRMADSRPADLR
ncbi:MAG: ATP-binding protein [Rhodoferax sp.]|uniref:ATP-binding protein n=1 Tax=Rhodoferax sp. TaxID=50421 RepID=UPI00260EEAC8|nr:ATP-binding protein [Rhodoferax sp.]MDD2881841.1 ATP-binding protein [Rhodoferax sp.]